MPFRDIEMVRHGGPDRGVEPVVCVYRFAYKLLEEGRHRGSGLEC
jgi:hypothetical protein